MRITCLTVIDAYNTLAVGLWGNDKTGKVSFWRLENFVREKEYSDAERLTGVT
jgi:hypothetical protein